MNSVVAFTIASVAGYLIGAIPFGLILVKLKTGEDLLSLHSGRTGTTNAMRAAGVWIGIGTVILDMLKGVAAIWLARTLMPDNAWTAVAAGLLVIIGHNYSIYLIDRDEAGRIRLRGGAGGAPCLGGAVGIWWPAILIILPIGILVFYFIGYASVATISVAVLSTIIFTVLYFSQGFPWPYIVYGIAALALLLWALRPNLVRLANGTERLVGYRARKRKDSAPADQDTQPPFNP